MTTSIQAGVQAATGNGYIICLGDMVTITADEYALLKKEFEKYFLQNEEAICIPFFKNEKGNPVIFSSHYKLAILQHIDMEGCKAIVQTNKENIYKVQMQTPHVLQDMDYLHDYKMLSKEQNV
ncbi:MAG TPA: NTP transferase domain-containing protein, partial [Chitinophagaceae bacterium]|nr:NTP transferase domain-containing protein [Chitinophagaceae bacterium]